MNGNSISTPKISVITVVRNGEATLRRTVESIVSRLGDFAEYLIVDGASTDQTVKIIEENARHLSYWTSEPDKGIYDAMNKALTIAKGDWVIFMGADDELIADLDDIARSLTEIDTIYYGNVSLMSSGKISAGRFNRYKLMQQNICHQAILYPRSVYSTKSYSTDSGLIADHKYNIELWGNGAPFKYLPCVISRFNDTGASSVRVAQFEEMKLRAIKANFGPVFYGIKIARTAAARMLRR